MHIRFLFFLVLPAIGLILGACNQAATDYDARPIPAALQEAKDVSGTPGIGLVVASADEIIELHVLGERRLGGGDALQANDPFHIGSVTKPFTATIIAQLVEEGRLNWDSNVAEVLDGVIDTAGNEFSGVTLAHLLAHEAGMQPLEEEHELDNVPEWSGDIRSQRNQFSKWIVQQEPIVPPLQEYRYSNAHFIVAAAMAEKITGRSWEELVRLRIFEELSMDHAGFGWPAKGGVAEPWGHRYVDDGLVPVDPDGDYVLPSYLGPAGDIHASLGGLGLFLQAYLRAWNGDGALLKDETVRRLWTRRLRSGLGWGSTEAFGFEPVAMFSGSADTFLTVVVVIPDADVAVAVAANAYSEEVEKAVVGVLRDAVGRHIPGE